MKQPWNHIGEVRGRGSEEAKGLEYVYPCCGGTIFVSNEQIKAYLNAPHDEAVGPAPAMCPICPEADEEIEQIKAELNPQEA